MMATEDEARVSLDGTGSDFVSTSETSSTADAGKTKAERRARRAARARAERREDAKRKRRRKSIWRRLFGLRHPLVGGESWESVGTSWVVPDGGWLAWRFASFAVVVAAYAYLAVTRSLSFEYYTTDVFLCELVSSSLFLLPTMATVAAGPHEDELDKAHLRWVWTLVAFVFQTTVTNVVFLAMCYWIFFDAPSAAAGGGLDIRSQALLHGTALFATGGELLLGCVEMRAAYAAAGGAALAMYLVAVGGGHHAATGQWLYGFLQAGTPSGALSAHLAVGVIYALAVALVLAAERGRRAVARCVERGRFADGEVF